ncbi:Zinc resistance conferring protein, partial [Coemansia guatemalensis]
MAKLSRTAKVSLMLVLSSTMFFVELIVGIIAGSITLVADSFHMLNDVLGMVIALWAIMMAKSEKAVPNNTYGWQRAEILGALTNGVLLLGLCLTIYIDAIERFIQIEQVKSPKLVMLVGCVGLAFNLLGLMLFHEHGHGHSHGHAHGDAHAHVHGDEEEVVDEQERLLGSGGHGTAYNAIDYAEGSSTRMQSSAIDNRSIIGVPHPVYTQQAIINSAQQMIDGEYSDESSDPAASRNASGRTSPQIAVARRKSHAKRRKSSSGRGGEGSGGSGGHLNMHGVWLHVFGDCITNVAVIISGLVIWKAEGSWRFYLDPAMSLLINTLIVCITVPLVKSASFILLNGVPSSVDLEVLRRELRAIPHVLNVHDLHVWQLSDTKNVASVHVLIDRPLSHQCIHNSNSSSAANVAAKANDYHTPVTTTTTTAASTAVRLVSRNRSLNSLSTPGAVDMDCLYMDVASEVKRAMHKHGIHSTTIQPEFVVGQPVSVATTNAHTADSASFEDTAGDASSAQHNDRDERREGSIFSKVAIAPGHPDLQNTNNGSQVTIGP